MTRDRAIEILRDDAGAASLWELAEAVDMAIEALKDPKQGEWEHWGSPFSDDTIADSIVCSVCKARFVEIKGEVFNFCPNCGARMKEGGEE